MRYTRSVVSTSEVLNINSYLYGIVADYNRTNRYNYTTTAYSLFMLCYLQPQFFTEPPRDMQKIFYFVPTRCYRISRERDRNFLDVPSGLRSFSTTAACLLTFVYLNILHLIASLQAPLLTSEINMEIKAIRASVDSR